MASPPDASRLDTLADALRGRLVRPGDADYGDARAVWNGMIDRRPAAIARCRSLDDVAAAVAVARETGLPASIRGGGHNVAGTAVCDDGLVVDCSPMTDVVVDPAGRTARVAGGATWADVDAATQPHGLAAPGGVVSETGVAGLTLGGGIGHLRRPYGLSCDNLRSVELVTAAGERVTASPDEHPDLFWGLRGGGGGLGVVTAFEFDLHPVGPEVATVLVFYDADDLPAVLAGYRAYVADAPRAVSSLTFAGTLPEPALFDPPTLHAGKIAVMACHAGDPAEGEQALRPLRELAVPLADESAVTPYVEFQQLLDADYPDGMRYYWKSLYLDGLPASAIERVAHWADAAPSPLSTVDVWPLGGAVTEGPPGATAFAGRHAPFLLGVEANWEDPAEDEANVQWVRDCLEDFRQYSDGGVYLNFPGFIEDREAMLETTFGGKYERLEALKREWDPAGLFSC